MSNPAGPCGRPVGLIGSLLGESVVVVHQWDCGPWAESSLVGEVFSGQFAEAAADGAEQAELARARDGDDAAFTRLVAPLRRAGPPVPSDG
jgi:hypothetical protein